MLASVGQCARCANLMAQVQFVEPMWHCVVRIPSTPTTRQGVLTELQGTLGPASQECSEAGAVRETLFK